VEVAIYSAFCHLIVDFKHSVSESVLLIMMEDFCVQMNINIIAVLVMNFHSVTTGSASRRSATNHRRPAK